MRILQVLLTDSMGNAGGATALEPPRAGPRASSQVWRYRLALRNSLGRREATISLQSGLERCRWEQAIQLAKTLPT